jgi:hypothetical protein
MASEKSLAFWEDEHTKVLHLPTGRVFDIANMTDIFIEGKELNAARAWYNSNLLIDDYMPKIFPFFNNQNLDFEENVSNTLENYFYRIQERNIGKNSPKRPTIDVFHGLVKLDHDNGILEVFLKQPNCNIYTCFYTDGRLPVTVENCIERDPGFAYWDGKCYV